MAGPCLMQFYTSDDFTLPLPENHRFPVQKYEMLRRKLLDDALLSASQLRPAPLAHREDLRRAHSETYLWALETGDIEPAIMRRIGFPWSDKIFPRGARTAGGALAAARSALQTGLSGQLAGGTHHAHKDFGAGFCILNDFAVVALTLLFERAVKRIAIIDLDVHQGDGNAAILGDHPDILILDLHGEKNFPFRKVPASLHVPLNDQIEDDAYLQILEEHLPQIWQWGPDLVLFQAGVDPLHSDKLGRMKLTFEGLKARDQLVLAGCKERGIACSMAIGGGYAVPIEDTVTAYANTYKVAKSLYGF